MCVLGRASPERTISLRGNSKIVPVLAARGIKLMSYYQWLSKGSAFHDALQAESEIAIAAKDNSPEGMPRMSNNLSRPLRGIPRRRQRGREQRGLRESAIDKFEASSSDTLRVIFLYRASPGRWAIWSFRHLSVRRTAAWVCGDLADLSLRQPGLVL
jgi:hypothetical protein